MACPKCQGGGDRFVCMNEFCEDTCPASYCDMCVPENNLCPTCEEPLWDTFSDQYRRFQGHLVSPQIGDGQCTTK